MSYDIWLGNRANMEFTTPDIHIALVVEDKMETIFINPTAWYGIPNKEVFVVMCEREKEYCGDMKILERHDFGEYKGESYIKATECFKNLVSNIL